MMTKYGAGQRVTIRRSTRTSAPEGRYKIVRAMPNSGAGVTHYRVKNELEQFERIVDETCIVETTD